VKRETVAALAVALAWGCCVSVTGYAIIRFIQFFLYPDPNPATLVWSAHAGFFWRCWTCGYAGALASFIAYVGAQRGPERAARTLAGAVATSAVLLALQVAVFP
jgi:choline-glycine betaine transporter